MADLNKFEEMLERLVNEDKDGAEELFHEIVVEKSREIYENLLEADLDDEEVDEATDEEVDESDEEVDEATDEEVDESDEDLDENFDLDEFEVEADPMDMDMGDPANDMMGDVEMPDAGEEPGEEGEEELEDRVMDLEDALEDLKAEFDSMMADGDNDGDVDGHDHDMGDEGDDDDEAEEEAMAFETTDEEVDEASDEEVDEATDEEVDEGEKSQTETMREYVEKVTASMGDTGTNGTKSAVAGKNDMGGTAGNLNQSAVSGDPEAGAGSTVKGNALSDTSAKEDSAGNVNVPGGKASKSLKSQPGHGAEKKGKPETADKAATSTLNKVSTRAK